MSHALGIDIGGTKIAAGVVDCGTGAVSARQQIATDLRHGPDALLADVLALAERTMVAGSQSVAGIGVGVCELVNHSGTIISGHTLGWEGRSIAPAFAKLAPRVAIDGDVFAHALAEARFGIGRQYDPFVYVTIGTGISSCLVIGGRPYRGAHGGALVLATGQQTYYDADGGARRFALEEFASGPAIATRYRQASGAHIVRAETVLAAADGGDLLAIQVVDSAAIALGSAIGWLINLLDPAAVVLGGGLGLAGGTYKRRLLAAAREHSWAPSSQETLILTTALGPDSGIIGAALLAA